MSNRFHAKWHRYNHHTDPGQHNTEQPDATHDPIASHEDPFRGDFVVKTGTVSAQDPYMGGWFSSYSDVSGRSLYATNPYRYVLGDWYQYPDPGIPPDFNRGLAGYFDGNVVINHALSAGSIWSPYLSATYADIDVINIHVSELSGFTISGNYHLQTPLDYNCYTGNPGKMPYERLELNGVGLSSTSWAAFNGDIITHNNAYVEGTFINNNISGCGGTEISIHTNTHFVCSVRIDGNLNISGDTAGESNLSIYGSAWIAGDLDVDGFVLNPTATNLWVSGTTYTDCILPFPADKYITMGCVDCHGSIWDFDATSEMGVKICGDLSGNRIFGLLNSADTKLLLSAEQCFDVTTYNQELWSQSSIYGDLSSTFDGLVVITTEADEVSGYANVACYTDDILVGRMVVSNPGNITNSNISHPVSAERILESKQAITFPIIAQKPWNIELVESYGRTCHTVRVYQHIRSVNMTELIINENLFVGGSSIFMGPVYFNDDVFMNSSLYINQDLYLGGDLNLDCSTITNVSAIHNDGTCVDLIDFNTSVKISTSGALVLPVGPTVPDIYIPGTEPSYLQQGAIRYNTSINSFEGYSGSFWAGLGGVTKVNGDGSIAGTARAMVGPVTAIAFGPPQLHDIWVDTNQDVIKVFDNTNWVILGAAYSP